MTGTAEFPDARCVSQLCLTRIYGCRCTNARHDPTRPRKRAFLRSDGEDLALFAHAGYIGRGIFANRTPPDGYSSRINKHGPQICESRNGIRPSDKIGRGVQDADLTIRTKQPGDATEMISDERPWIFNAPRCSRDATLDSIKNGNSFLIKCISSFNK